MAENIVSKYGIAADAVLIAAFFGTLAVTMDATSPLVMGIMAAMGAVSIVQMSNILAGN